MLSEFLIQIFLWGDVIQVTYNAALETVSCVSQRHTMQYLCYHVDVSSMTNIALYVNITIAYDLIEHIKNDVHVDVSSITNIPLYVIYHIHFVWFHWTHKEWNRCWCFFYEQYTTLCYHYPWVWSHWAHKEWYTCWCSLYDQCTTLCYHNHRVWFHWKNDIHVDVSSMTNIRLYVIITIVYGFIEHINNDIHIDVPCMTNIPLYDQYAILCYHNHCVWFHWTHKELYTC